MKSRAKLLPLSTAVGGLVFIFLPRKGWDFRSINGRVQRIDIKHIQSSEILVVSGLFSLGGPKNHGSIT
tara:strand:- start:61 stop:267 length:207 start_codon:yes stop_codon:yes gene_type:complete